MLRETYPIRTVASLGDFSAAKVLWLVIAINVSRANNEKAVRLKFVIAALTPFLPRTLTLEPRAKHT